MIWTCLAVGIVAAILSLGALLPLRGPVGSFVSWIPRWIVSEAPLHLMAIALGVTVGCGLAGGFSSWPGWVGLGLAIAASAGLVPHVVAGLGADQYFDVAFATTGSIPSHRSWSARDIFRVVLAVPIRSRSIERVRNISYNGDTERLHRLDLYRRVGMDSSHRAPVLMYFHGGTWLMGDKRGQGIPMLEHLAEKGYVCVSANYALSPKARWPQHIMDCKQALVWVKRNIASYGGDPNLVFVAGGSAGGHLAALVALSAGDPTWQPGFEHEDTTVAGCIPVYGIYDLLDADKMENANLAPILEHYIFGHASAQTYAAASPICRVEHDAPPFFVVHGRDDVLVPIQAVRAFVGVLRAKSGQPVIYVELPLAQHLFDTFWSPRTVHFLHALERFLEQVIAARAPDLEA